MESKWKELFPNRFFSVSYMNAGALEANMINTNILMMFLFQGIVALLLSVTGLYTLVSLNIIKRLKEIGVRKVLGASLANIARIVNTQFIIIVALACLAGPYLGMFLSELLMGSIWEHHQTPSLISAIIACVVLVIVCGFSIISKIYEIAKTNPTEVLRNE